MICTQDTKGQFYYISRNFISFYNVDGPIKLGILDETCGRSECVLLGPWI